MYKLLTFLIITLFLSSCHPPQKVNSNVDKIVYSFRDASVAPQYHKSYTITVTAEKASIVVNSYDKVLGEGENNVNAKDWNTLIELSNAVQEPGEFIAEGATGTRGYSIKKYSKGKEIYRLYWDSLSESNISGDSKKLVEQLHKLSPGMLEVIK